MRSRSIHFFLLVTTVLLASCGGGGYREKRVIDYRLYFKTDNPKVIQAGQRLISQYNQQIGAEVLSLSDTPGDANSPVTLVEGLREREGKLGYGQWETHTSQEPAYRRIEGRALRKTVVYEMNIEFDRTYVEERADLPADNADWQELYLLFCHEVGHGLQMVHDPDRYSVMYYYIDGVKGVKWDEYFQHAREFFDLN